MAGPRIIASVATVAIASLFIGSLASAAPPSVSEPSRDDLSMPSKELILAQERLDALAEQLVQADTKGQIATTEVDQDNLTFTVRLAGDTPPEMADVIASAPKDITTVVERARFSMADMQAAGKRIHEAVKRGEAPDYFAIVSNNDGSGLTVEVESGILAKTQTAAFDDPFEKAAGLPVEVKQGEPIVPTSRGNDADPWRGGAQIDRSVTFCTTAFSVLRPDGFGRILSAAHCDFYGNAGWTDWAGDPFTGGGASAAVDRVPYDTLIIDPIGGTQGRVYGGPWNATSSDPRYSLKVAATDGSHVGDFICTSGANSGEHCHAQVMELGVQFKCGINLSPPPAEQCGGHRAISTTSSIIDVGGDSGGPVYENRSDGRVNALGVVYGGSTPGQCGSLRSPVSNCYRTLVYPAIRPILARWGVSIETVP